MEKSLVQKALDGVPQTEEDRMLVLRWAISLVKDEQVSPEVSDSDDKDTDLPQSGSHPVSEKRSGVSGLDEPIKDREPTASSGGLTSKGLTASPGGPKVDVSTQHTSTKNAMAKTVYRDAHQQNKGEEEPPAKRQRMKEDDQSDLDGDHVLLEFDPSSLTEPKEGTCKVPQMMAKYLGKHLRRALPKEEREAMSREHPRPDVESAFPPKVDKYIKDFAGNRFPKQYDEEMSLIQNVVLKCISPLTSAWKELIEEGVMEHPELQVSAPAVLQLIQRTICYVGNASEYISEKRRSKILGTIHSSWEKFARDGYPNAEGFLFGDDFQSTITGKVERESVLAKALSLSRKAINAGPVVGTSFGRRDERKSNWFFRGSPASPYGGRQGRSTLPFNQRYQRGANRFRQGSTPQRGPRPRFHEPFLPPTHGPNQKRQ